MLSPSVWEQESSHNSNEFDKTLCHEITHVFTRRINKSCEPMWLNEGLACVVAKQMVRLQENNYPDFFNPETMSLLDTRKKWERTITKELTPYATSFLLVEFLIRRFGKQKIFRLLKVLDRRYGKKKFYQRFEEVYGGGVIEVKNEFLEAQQIKPKGGEQHVH